MTSQKFSKTRKVLADHDYVVAQEAELEGTIRVFTPDIRKQTKARPAILYCRLRAVARMK